ncbi:MAG: hypothetical protein GTO14_22620, partial [Anaerolineales bacterium]|nr:hypothetical protein [Anaerolineales bacterium]
MKRRNLSLRRIAISSSQIIRWLAIYTGILVPFVTFLNLFSDDAEVRAKVLMGFFLVVIWCLGFGLFSYIIRDKFKRLFRAIKFPWQIKFLISVIALAMLEEVVTVSLTNAAPLLGSETGRAMVTASTNYLEVVFLNSVWPVFVPWFLAWTVLLTRYDFPPNHVFLLFGLLGSIGETYFGIGALVAGFWFFVYGLMVYLPAYSLPQRKTVPLRWWHYIYGLLLPFLLM